MTDRQQPTAIVTDKRFGCSQMVLLAFCIVVVVPGILFVGCTVLGLGASVAASKIEAPETP